MEEKGGLHIVVVNIGKNLHLLFFFSGRRKLKGENENSISRVGLCFARFPSSVFCFPFACACEDKMGSILRSKPMLLVQLYIQIEAAHDTIDELGKLGLVQFRDVSGRPLGPSPLDEI